MQTMLAKSIGCAPLLIFLFSPSQTLSQANGPDRFEQSKVSSHVLLGPQKRIVFASAAFASGSIVPHWEKSYLVSFVPETASPGMPNVRLFDPSGNKVREATIWFPGAQTVSIVSAAVAPDEAILVSGTAVKADGTRAGFIASTDRSGRVVNAIQTHPFFPANICAASDGTVWSFGDFESGPGVAPASGNMLRQFDFQRGLINSYLPRSTFAEEHFSPAQRANERQEVYFRCTPGRITIYSGVVGEYIEFDPAINSLKRFKIDRSVNNLPLHGFAVTDRGDVYGYLRDYSDSNAPRGLFYLQKDEDARSVRWLPVAGAAGKSGQAGVVNGLWGADGEYLVHGFGDDPSGRWGVSWSLPRINTFAPL